MIAVFKREFLSFFRGFTGWLFLAVNLAVYGLYFTIYDLMNGIPNIAYALNGMTFIFLITVPILTMRVLSAERRDKTDQLSMTSPVGAGSIVIGKYLALACCYAIVMVFMAASPLVLRLYGLVSLRENYTALLGFFLYGLALLAVGEFASSLTSNVIVSAVLSFVLIFIGYISSSLSNALSLDGIPAKILSWYDFITPLSDFLSDSLSLKNVVYYLTVIFICLALTTQIILKRRYTVSLKRFSLSAFSLVTIVCVAAVSVGANYAIAKVPEKYSVFDMTRKKVYSLTDASKKVLEELDTDVTIYCLAKKSELTYDYEIALVKTLDQYSAASDHIKVKYVDTSENPTFASEYTDEDLDTGSLIIVSGDRSRTVSVYDLYETEVDYSTYSQQITGYDIEGQITSAIKYLDSESLEKVCVLTGHGEPEMSASFTKALQKLNATTQELNLLEEDSIDADTAAVIIFGPQTDISEDDAEKLSAYVKNGGRIFVALDVYKNRSLKNLNAFLNENGIRTTKGAIAENDPEYYYDTPYLLLPEVKETSATSDVTGKLQVFMPLSVGLKKVKNNDLTFLNLAVTSEKAIAKNSMTDSDSIASAMSDTDVKKSKGDTVGRFSLALIAKNKNDGMVAAFGSVYTFTDQTDQQVSGRNTVLFSDVFSYLLPEDSKASVSIPVKSTGATTLTINARSVRIIGLTFSVLLPLVLIIYGIAVCIIRRRR